METARRKSVEFKLNTNEGTVAPYGEDTDVHAEPPLQPATLDGETVVMRKADMVKVLEVMDQAAELLGNTAGAKSAELSRRLQRVISDVGVSVPYNRPSRPAKKAVHKPGFSLGQVVEVRYMANDIVQWEEAKVVPGSGGGLYSVEFSNGEIWDKIPGDDLRACSEASSGFGLRTQRKARSPWNLATPSEHLMYNGWMFMESSDWSWTKTKTWGMIIGSKFYYGRTPHTEDWTVRDLFGAKLTEKSLKSFQVTNDRFDYSFTLTFDLDYEFKVWKVQIEAAILRAAQKPDYAKIAEGEAQLDGMVKRPLLPMFEPNAVPEKNTMATLCSYIVTSHGATWLGTKDWKRRWVTLHPGFLCIRTDRNGPQGLEVLPFREVKCWAKPMSDHPHTLEVTGAWINTHLLCFDNVDTFKEWRKAINSSILASNPEDLEAQSKPQDDVPAIHRGIS